MKHRLPRILLAGALLLSLAGCAATSPAPPTPPAGTAEAGKGTAPPNLSYFPSGITDIELPRELQPVRDETMFIETASYHGGVLVFEGRVEISSLTDYLAAVMQKNGWRLAGAVRYENALLAYVKPGKSCTITIIDGGLMGKTRVAIYLTEEAGSGTGPGTGSGPDIP